jgi:hypothetical protein
MSATQRLFLVGVVLTTLPGCLVFDRQRIVVVTPGPGEKVGRVLFLYEGLCAAGTEGREFDEACADLKSLVEGDRFYLGHWMLPVDLTEPRGGQENPDDRAWRLLFRKHLRLDPASFFRDRDGRLCVRQAGTVADVPSFLRDLNERVSQSARTDSLLTGSWVDDAVRTRLTDAANKGHPWWTVEPGKLHYTLPLTPEHAVHYKRQLFEPTDLNELSTNLTRILFPEDGEDRPQPDNLIQSLRNAQQHVLFLIDNPLGLTQRRDRLTLSLGHGDGLPIDLLGPRLAIPLPPEVRDATVKLEGFARTLNRPFRGDSAEQIRSRFLQGKLE